MGAIRAWSLEQAQQHTLKWNEDVRSLEVNSGQPCDGMILRRNINNRAWHLSLVENFHGDWEYWNSNFIHYNFLQFCFKIHFLPCFCRSSSAKISHILPCRLHCMFAWRDDKFRSEVPYYLTWNPLSVWCLGHQILQSPRWCLSQNILLVLWEAYTAGWGIGFDTNQDPVWKRVIQPLSSNLFR